MTGRSSFKLASTLKIVNTFNVGKGFVTYTAIAVLLLASAPPVWAKSAMTLREAVTAGVLKNPAYGVVAKGALAQREVLFQAMGLKLPSLDFLAETGSEQTDTPYIHDVDQWRSRSSLSLTQLLFDGWGASNRVEGERARLESSSKQAGEAAENTGLDTVEAFFDVLRQRQLLDIAKQNAAEHARFLEMIDAGAQAGTTTQGDVAQIKARLAQARASVANAEERLRRAESSFAQKTGSMPEELAEPELPRKELPPSVEEAVLQILAHNPSMGVADAEIKASAADQKAVGSLFYPRITIEANASVGDNLEGVAGNQNTQSILAVSRWNLYHGGMDIARKREASYRNAIAKDRRLQTARDVEKDTRDTWAAMVSAAARAGEYGEQVKSNEKVVSVYLDQFTISKRTLLDVLDAQNELFVSRSNAIDAHYAEKFAAFRLLSLRGGLLDTLGVARPAETALAAVRR